MIAPPEFSEVEHFRMSISRRLGLHFDDGKLGDLADLLRRRLDATSRTPETYLAGLDVPWGSREEFRSLARELTVAETYFFRNADQMRAFGEAVLPDRIRAQAARRRLRILSAGCASGEEAYSLAILVSEMPDAAGWDVAIHGIDVNLVMLDKAARAHYPAWSLRETPAALQARFFRSEGGKFILDGRVRGMVTFEERNLAEDDAAFWHSGAFDIVFCRNVTMYFTPETAQAVIARIARSLSPGGFLFLGHAETLRGISQDFHLRHTHETFYYQRKDAPARPHRRQAADESGHNFGALGVSLAATVDTDNSWIETIRRASERIEFLTAPPAMAPGAAPAGPMPARAAAPGATRPALELGLTLELLRHERFPEALAILSALPPESAGDPEVLLLRAVLLTHGGDLAAAEKECAALLKQDEMSAGAHYLMALCRENNGDRGGAADHDQMAVYLDPGFAMPRLHLGLLARRSGDSAAARRELGRALLLLQREDASRLIMFGGGFGRDALMALCQAELTACGGAP